MPIVAPNDPVNHPEHYASHPSGVECIELSQHLPFCEGNALKYIWRAGHKADRVEDLKKAQWYLERAARIKNRRPPRKVRWALSHLVHAVYVCEPSAFRREMILIIIESVCCRSKKERQMKLGAAAAMTQVWSGEGERCA